MATTVHVHTAPRPSAMQLQMNINASRETVNWLVKRVECDIRNFFDSEFALREEALKAQDSLRNEIRSLEDRCVRSEQELQARNSRLLEMDEEIERRSRQYQDRIGQLEAAAHEDGKAIVSMRDAERTLRTENDRLAAQMNNLREQNLQNDRMIGELQEKIRFYEDKFLRDESDIIQLREGLSHLQSENENLANQAAILEDHVNKTTTKLKLAEEQAALDERTITDMREGMTKMKDENEGLLRITIALEERNAINEAKLRRLLDDVGEEVGKMKHEVDRQRRDLEVTGGSNVSLVASPSRLALYSPSHRTAAASPLTMSPRHHHPTAGAGREVNLSVKTSPYSDLSLRLDSLQNKLRGR